MIRGIISALNGRSHGWFKLPLRQKTGTAAGLLKLANLDGPEPDYDLVPAAEDTGGPDPVSARHPALSQGIVETLDGIPHTQPDRSEDALAGSLGPVALNLLDLKSFGVHIEAKDPDRQTAEIRIRIAMMNSFSALGTAEIVRVA